MDDKDRSPSETLPNQRSPVTNLGPYGEREHDSSSQPFGSNENAVVYSVDSNIDRQRKFKVNGQTYSLHPSSPPAYRRRASSTSSSDMTGQSLSTRASSLGHRNNAQYRSLDRRKEEVKTRNDSKCTINESTEIKDQFYESKASYPSYPHEKSSLALNGFGTYKSYPFPQDRPSGPEKPLVSYVKNDWRYRDPRHTQKPLPREEEICPEGWSDILCSHACKRWMVLYLLIMIVVWIWWFNYYGPRYVENNFLRESLNARSKSQTGHFGMNKRVSFAGLTQLSQLDRRLVPGSEVKGAKKRRLVVVGDIHGCIEELNSLLDLVNFDSQKDHLIATGDCISKGPHSSAVLDALILNNASSVRGNHEDKILLAHRDHYAPSHQKFFSEASPSSSAGPVTLKHGATSDLQLAASLTEDQFRFAASWPLILSLGPITGMGNVSIVHAGLNPGVPLLRQDPISVMNMRSIDLRNHLPSSRPAPVPGVDRPRVKDFDTKSRVAIRPWTVLWNAWQEMQPTNARETVIYGHDSKKGVVQGSWSLGLDGGCVNGGKLAALVIEETSRGDVKKEVVSVPCKDYTAAKVLRPLGEN